MTSARKIKTNRANAQASTGPKTAKGKTRSARNARRHGLSLSVNFDSALSGQVELLAREIAVEKSNSEIYQLARRVAEAQIDLIRIRGARHDYEFGMEAKVPPHVEDLIRLQKPQGAPKILAILSDSTRQFNLMDRYERRALSRRKFAIRAFDLARRQCPATARSSSVV